MTETAVEALVLARSELTRRLVVVADGDWEKRTPCAEWNVRQLVNHVVGVHQRVARLLGGGSRDDYIETREEDWIHSDHIAAWHEGIRTLDHAIDTVGSLETSVAYRVPISGRDLVGLTAFETAVHTWDLSRAIGFDERLDNALVKYSLGIMEWIRNEPAMEALFETAKVHPPEDASAQDRLLRLAGREP